MHTVFCCLESVLEYLEGNRLLKLFETIFRVILFFLSFSRFPALKEKKVLRKKS